MKKNRKWITISTSAAMLMSMVAPAYGQTEAAVSTDLADHWAQASIHKWMTSGVFHGYEDGTFRPDQGITRAELVTILNGIFGFYEKAEQPFDDVPLSAWYKDAVSIAKQAGYYQGFPGNLAKAETDITREDAIVLLARAFEKSAAGEAALQYTDKGDIKSYALEAVQALAESVSGYEDGSFRPQGSITRAELVTWIDKLIAAYYSAEGTVIGGTINGDAVINHEGVVLKDAVISGDLYLTAGIGSGEVTLDHVVVKGTTYVSGGGDHTIIFNNATLGNVNVNRKEGSVRVLTQGVTKIGSLSANSESKLELGKGTTISRVEANKPVALIVGEGAAIEHLKLNTAAQGTTIEGQGTITKADVQAEGVKFNGKPVEKGSKVTVDKGTAAPAAEAATPSGNGSSGGSSGGSGGNSGGSSGGSSGGDNGSSGRVENLVDSQATEAAKSLFAYLEDTRGQQVLFGHQHTTDVGFTFSDMTGEHSDVKTATGDFPAVFGWDTLSLEGKEKPGVSGDPEQSRANLIDLMQKAHREGGIIALSSHMPNFVTGGSFNDTSGDVVEHILPGGDKNAEFNVFLDQIAALADNLKDDNGELIPILFRPFHEQNGGWFWWGAQTTSTSQYVEIYRYAVEYLRDQKHVHNLLYVFSPNGTFGGNQETYLKTYPGDDYVDILGMDQYDNQSSPGTTAFLNNMVGDLAMISKLADAKGKIATFSEFGYSPSGMKTTGNGDLHWFTDVLNAIKADPDAKRIAYMQTWANFNLNGNLFVPYKDVETFEPKSHELLGDFVDFYNDPYTAFSKEVGTVYNKQLTAATEQPFMHIASPVEQSTVRSATTKIRARVLNQTPAKVVYIAEGSTEEVPMTLDEEGYYSADWSPAAAYNGKTTTFTVKVYGADQAVTNEQTNTVFVKVNEILMNELTFDNGIEGVQNNGSWSGEAGNGTAITTGFESEAADGNGLLKINTTGLVSTDTWQELKLELPGIKDLVSLPDVKRVKLDVYVPVSAGSQNADAALRGIVQLPPDWSDSGKYGMNSTYKKLSELEQITIAGQAMYKYPISIDLTDPQKSAEAASLAISIVGSGLSLDGPIYVDNIGLYSVYVEAPTDPAVVDTFEAYQGSSDALRMKFIGASGDGVTVSLDSANKQSGNYGMKYDYKLAGAGYAGATKTLGGVDWSKFNQLQAWMKTDGMNQKLVIQLKVDGGYYEYYPSTASTEGRLEQMAFNQFVPVHGATGTLTKEKLKNVQEFSIYTNAVNGAMMNSTFYFDDMKAVYDAASGSVPNGGTGSGSMPHEAGTLYDFETDVQGWGVSASENHADATAPSVTSDVYTSGSQALQSEFSLSGTSFELYKEESFDFSGVQQLSAKVKLSAGNAKARLYIKTGSNWAWYDSGTPAAVDASGFVTLTIPLTGVTDLDAVKAIGVKLEDISGSGTANVYVDEIALSN
ncbi:glycosyl hydrolase [Paenibacillus hexagrammi]|uniref:S-layer homology domain-containing protein n=1 Tax=Paenibacillus hexagrammi TaxID=2908839 RepID=A0ABY3SL44_9BACL|nr:glycosyl hydrolase [Paenibacillus sp. YPD9-1]UJF33939.1 S-layer homology domain-containing protein [Paenibacillus sp. YPD9-1]